VEVGCEEDHLGGGDGELAFLGTGGCAYYADDVAAPEEFVRWDEGVLILGVSDDGKLGDEIIKGSL
jgi:hypothetical protein